MSQGLLSVLLLTSVAGAEIFVTGNVSEKQLFLHFILMLSHR